MNQHHPFSLVDARVVTVSGIERISVHVRDGRIRAIDAAHSSDEIEHDCAGDYLLPGLIELHTDNIERHLEPRPGTFRTAMRAVLSHDAELAAAGITTAFDALTIGADIGHPRRDQAYLDSLECIHAMTQEGTLRLEHLFHLRCELSDPRLAENLALACAKYTPRMISLMDHTPGQGQWDDVERFRRYYAARYGMNSGEIADLISRRQEAHLRCAVPNRTLTLACARTHGCVVASHDSTTSEEVTRAQADGCSIVEFPTTAIAARRARELALAVVAGAPNLVRGTSHSGNVSAATLADAGLIDVLSSDYCPSSLLEGIFQLARVHGWPLHQAVATATSTPSRVVGLLDRGTIDVDQRADVVRVRDTTHGPVIISAWCAGRQVA